MIGFYNYSVILTYIGLASSVFGMTQVFEGDYAICFLCLLLSGICDMFDGKVARAMKNRTEQEKVFGIQIDSLCDLVCFTVFPAMIGYSFGLNHGLGLVAAIALVLAGVIRLGFFNVMEQERQRNTKENRKEYQGLPVTSVAVIFPLIYLAKNVVGSAFPYIYQGFMIVIALLFLLRVKVRKPSMKGLLLLATLGVLILIGFWKGNLY